MTNSKKDKLKMVFCRWQRLMLEWRHNPCLMTPISAMILLIVLVLSIATLACQVPTILIGILISPFTRRMTWLVEFLYPSSLARWGHLALLKWSSKTANGVRIPKSKKKKSKDENDDESPTQIPLHSRSIEQRTEVVKGRVYVHPLPQLLDNIGYLIVCLPPIPSQAELHLREQASLPSSGKKDKKKKKGKKNKDVERTTAETTPISPILAILVDCGDAQSCIQQMEYIRDVHYSFLPDNPPLKLCSILSTHKHHDHTAGNRVMLRHTEIGKSLKRIYGGVIEKVPHCTNFVKNGDFIDLPRSGTNDMRELVEIECIAVPSHTRGSIIYNLKNKPVIPIGDNGDLSRETVVSHLFAGDAMFSAGAGVPFEADLGDNVNINTDGKGVNTTFNASGGIVSTERVFSEVLVRALDEDHGVHTRDGRLNATNQMLLFPGHEYTLDLLHRQFDRTQEYYNQWMKQDPYTFFEMASHFFVMNHRRSLPKVTRLLTVPSTIRKEMKINPYFRNLKKRGEHVLKAVSVWYKHGKREESIRQLEPFSKENSKYIEMPDLGGPLQHASTTSEKTPSSDNTWTTNHTDLNKSVFTTVYASDLEEVIYSLKNGAITPDRAAKKLEKMTKKMEDPPILRRPIPGTLPNEKSMYMGLIAMAALGSAPNALTHSDGDAMNLPEPVVTSDYLLISKRRLISALRRLDLLPPVELDPHGDNELLQMIQLLWKEVHRTSPVPPPGEVESGTSNEEVGDLIELGILKLNLFCVSYNQQSWFSTYCMPCSKPKETTYTDPRTMKQLKRSGGELVRHDATRCPMCSDVIGCPIHCVPVSLESDEDEEEEAPQFAPNLLTSERDVEMKFVQKKPNTSKKNQI